MNPEDLSLEEIISIIVKKMNDGDIYDDIKRNMTNPKTRKNHLGDIDDEEFRAMIEGLTKVYEEKKKYKHHED